MNFRRILSFALSQALFFILPLIAANAHAGTIYRQWHMQGYSGTATSGSFPGMSRISGQVRMTTEGFEFSGSAGTFTLTAPLTPADDYFELVKEETEEKSTNYISSTRAKITRVDDDTLLLSYGHARFEKVQKVHDYITSFTGYVAVLTAEPLPIQASPPTRHPILAGRYDLVRTWMEMSETPHGVEGGTQQRAVKIVANPNGTCRVFESDDPLLMERAPGYGIYRALEYSTDRFVRVDGPMYSEVGELLGYYYVWNRLERENFELLDLGDGRVLYSQMRAVLVDIVHKSLDASEVQLPPHVGYSEMACALLKTKAVGRVHELIGTEEADGEAWVIREGTKMAIHPGDLIYEADELITREETTLNVAFFEGSGMTVHQNTRLKITKFSAKGTGSIELFKGRIDSRVAGGNFYIPVKLRIKTPNAIITVGPSGFPIEFSVDYNETELMAQTKLQVFLGLVEISNADGSAPQPVHPTQLQLKQTQVKRVQLRIQAPAGSSLVYDGEIITTFPRLIEVPVGTEVTLAATPPVSRAFSHWWTREPLQNESITFTAGSDMDLQPEAYLSGEEAESILAVGLAAAGLEGEDAQPGASPFNDGNPNLVKWAFNMNLSEADSRSLGSGDDAAGLPAINVAGDSGPKAATYQYLRRTDGSLVYQPMVSSDLTNWEPMGAPENVQSLGNGWEKVTHSVPLSALSPGTLNFRIQVRVPGS